MTLQIIITGTVTHGQALGRKLGYPTANITLDQYNEKDFGVYLTRIETQNQKSYFGVLSIGRRSSVVSGGEVVAECHIFDFSGDLYGKQITLYTLEFLRHQVRYDTIEELTKQINKDIEYSQTLIKKYQNHKEMKSIKGTKTEKNLLAAFAGESQARNRYNMYAKQARKEGYEVIAKFFDETAENERQHAKQFFSFLEGGMVEIVASYPAGIVGTTIENLKEAAEGEYDEWYTLYPEAAKIAKEEGFDDVARKFTQIAEIEKAHEERYRGLLATLIAEGIFHKEETQIWRCRECGFEHSGTDALKMCPVCNHPQAFQEIKNDTY